MGSSTKLQSREKISRVFLMIISIIGGGIVFQFGFLQLDKPENVSILILLVLFLGVVENFPMPVWRGFTTITFPLVYAIFVMEGLEYAIVIYALVIFAGNILRKRPLRIVFFNPAQLSISLLFAYFLTTIIFPLLPIDPESRIVAGVFQFSLFIVPFYIVNNAIVDLILVVRPQPYTFITWKQKTVQELNSFLISYSYLFLFIVLGNQNRGEIDVIAFFFFFSPLVGIALLTSSYVRLKKEKSRLKALFKMSSELNQIMPSKQWLNFLQNSLQEFIDVDACILWICEDGEWKRKFSLGSTNDKGVMTSSFEKIEQLKIYHNAKLDPGPAGQFFDDEILSFLYAPLTIEEELVGMFVFGRSRTRSFNEEDIQSGATLANQLAIVIKTKILFAEQEKRLILEERNRIARDIHDGVAQSLAGAVLMLETAERKFTKFPDDALRLIQDSNEKLRRSLKEVRESIYALRPYPTERVGLLSAMQSRMNLIKIEHGVEIQLETRGIEIPLSSMVEKIIFDIFQESIQNAIKHAQATMIDVLLSFQKEHVLLRVKDDGVGFSLFKAMIKAKNEPHFGILQMNELAEKIQASLQIDSKEGDGTEVALTVPRMGIEGEAADD